MMKTMGQFETIENEGPDIDYDMPPITGAPMPNAGIKNKTLGSVFPEKNDVSPKQFSDARSSAKRLKSLPKKSPLGPLTGNMSRPSPSGQPQSDQGVGMGDRWMGELWQGLTMGETQEAQGYREGYAGGGSVAGMDLYNQTMQELESGGIGGQTEAPNKVGMAHGGMVEQSREIASKGRNGDTMLMHIQPQELQGLQALLGPVTQNPETGNPEAFAWFAALPLLAQMAVAGTAGAGIGAGIGAIAGGKEGALQGLAIGGMAGLSLGPGILGAGAAPAVATPAITTAAPAVASSAAPTVASVAPTVAKFSAGLGGTGAKNAALSSTLMNSAFPVPSSSQLIQGAAAGSGGISNAGMAKAAATGLSSLSSIAGPRQSPQPMSPSPPAAPRPMGPVPSPYDKMRERQGGLRSLPGSKSVI
tara:strand:+ start:1762 stop:3012 length:1251 start_codon:yes stop_codon:yes gene_type:complete